MHDPLTVSLVIDPGFCRMASLDLSVPALLAGRAGWLSWDGGGLPIKAAVEVDAPRFEAWLADRLRRPPLERYRSPPS